MLAMLNLKYYFCTFKTLGGDSKTSWWNTPKNVTELFIYKVFVWYFEFELSTFIKNKNWSSFIIFLLKSILCHSQFTRLPLNGFYSGLLYFFNQRNAILMPKLRWRRYWWENVADVVVRKWMNEGCVENL